MYEKSSNEKSNRKPLLYQQHPVIPKIHLKLFYLVHWYTFPSNTNIIIGNTCYEMYQTIYQKGKEFIGKVFFLLREKLLPSLNLRYINISLKNISFLLK